MLSLAIPMGGGGEICRLFVGGAGGVESSFVCPIMDCHLLRGHNIVTSASAKAFSKVSSRYLDRWVSFPWA